MCGLITVTSSLRRVRIQAARCINGKVTFPTYGRSPTGSSRFSARTPVRRPRAQRHTLTKSKSPDGMLLSPRT